MAKIKLPFFREKEDRQIQQTAPTDRSAAPVTAEMPSPDLQAATAAKSPDTAQEMAKNGIEPQATQNTLLTPGQAEGAQIINRAATKEATHRLDVQALAKQAADHMNHRAEELSANPGEKTTEPTIAQAITRDGTLVREAATPGSKSKQPVSKLQEERRKINVKAAVRDQFNYREQQRQSEERARSEKEWTEYEKEKERAAKEMMKVARPLIRDVGKMILAVNVLGKTGLAASTLENIDRNDIPVASGGFRTPRPDPGLEQGALFPGQGSGPF